MQQLRTKISTKGQVVIPAAVRVQLGLEPGTTMAITVDGTKVILETDTVARKLRLIKELRGITAGGPSMTDALLEERRLERERELAEEGW